MESNTVISLIILAIIIILILYIISIYNKLVRLKNRYQNGFSQIEVQLKRRYDLIPNLIETAKGYLSHERETLEAVTAARNQALSNLQSAAKDPSKPRNIDLLNQAEGMLNNALGKLNVAVEAYPDLKANQNMMQLSEEMVSTENKIGFARQAFNDAVMLYNTCRQSFPNVMFAGMFGHGSDAQLLEFTDSKAIQEAPKVSF